MIIACENCKRRFRIEENRLDPKGSRVRCSHCSQVFVVYPPEQPKIEQYLFPDLEKTQQHRQKASVIALSNLKGGVAKTTSCLNLGVSLSLMKKKVLLIDFDVQASLSNCLGCQKSFSFYDAISDNSGDISKAIVKTRYPNLWLLPSNRNMVLLNKKYFATANFEYILKKKLNSVADLFDFILIDTPPSMEFYTLNALTAANWVIIPSNCEYLSTQGVHQTVNYISMVAGRTNQSLDYYLLITMFDEHDTVSKLIHSKLRKMYDDKAYRTSIASDRKIRESQIMNQPVIYYYKHSPSGLQYVSLAREILDKLHHG
jgi:chromosome partitioning protein